MHNAKRQPPTAAPFAPAGDAGDRLTIDDDPLPLDDYRPPISSRLNWPLWLGGLIVLLIALAAITGPSLAPRDPMQENTIIRVGDDWEIPPFPVFTVPGFPLGSDQFGRDILSRLLAGVRPTMIMVIVVAAVRLILGITIGLAAGWSANRVGQALDAVIGVALSVPVLIVALGAIAVLGVEMGLLAFIIGLSINGWVDTARLVREQTQIIKGNVYIEAAHALGASDIHILLRHVVRQIMPMAWMLFAFEISGTLMSTAGLGFLGYYIGGDVWVDVSDFVARRVSGTPELGQMLASAWSEQQILTEPWAMIVAGSIIFVTVLGFNLLGEGLRLRLGLGQVHVQQRTVLQQALNTVTDTVKQQAGSWIQSTRALGKKRILRSALAGALIVCVGGGVFWWRSQSVEPSPSAPIESSDHLWVTERHDPQGTLWTPVIGPTSAKIHWVFEEPAGLAGGPAIAADGTLYLTSNDGSLYAIDPLGNVLWQAPLPEGAVGVPALSIDGAIYVADQAGNLSTFDPEGNPGWRFQPETPGKAKTGPIVALDGTAFYPAGNSIYAVSSDGTLLWSAKSPFVFEPSPPNLDPTEAVLFFADVVLDVQDGVSRDFKNLSGKKSNEQYIVGADGQTYYRSESNITHWQLTASGAEILQNLKKQIPGIPKDAGVTQEGVVWGASKFGFANTTSGIVWFDTTDQVLGVIQYSQSPSRVLAVDGEATVYACGNLHDGSLNCLAVTPGAEETVWQLALENGKIVGGALAPDRLYVATQEGFFYAIGPAGEGN